MLGATSRLLAPLLLASALSLAEQQPAPKSWPEIVRIGGSGTNEWVSVLSFDHTVSL